MLKSLAASAAKLVASVAQSEPPQDVPVVPCSSTSWAARDAVCYWTEQCTPWKQATLITRHL